MVFRGARDYIHSTDLYDELIAGAKAARLPTLDGVIVLEMRAAIRTQPQFRFSADEGPPLSRAAAVFRLGMGHEFVFGTIVPSERPVVGRKPYDESRIAREARINDQLIELRADTGMSPIEVITALAVFQHKTLLPPPTGKRWLLVRLFLTRPLRPQDAAAVTISLDRVVRDSMTRSTVSVPNRQLGNLDFILGSASAQLNEASAAG
jgi:hypothetical protein